MALTISTPEIPDRATHDAVHNLARSVERRDGAPPLSDQALTHLGSASVTHLVAAVGDRVVGYAQVDGRSLEVAVLDPPTLAALLNAAERRSPEGLLAWSHGTRSPLATALEARGYRQVRVLHQLRRPLADLPEPRPAAEGVTVRPFEVGRDEDAWLAVNAAAFATHPEQGSWGRADLAAREAEPWFDPAGFLLAERDGTLLGYHWTKIHDDGTGEVYVLGVDPAAQGLGLGATLLDAGLASLAARGCPAVLLYVDDSNAMAMALYEKAGFARYDVDVQWEAPAPGR